MARRMPVDLDKLVAVRDALQAALDTLADVFPATVGVPAEPTRAAVLDDGEMTTSIRIHADKLFALKTLAHHRGARVNTLIDDAIDHYLELHGQEVTDG